MTTIPLRPLAIAPVVLERPSSPHSRVNSGHATMNHSTVQRAGVASSTRNDSGVGRVIDGPWIQVRY
ncbi:hypothetical protein [Schaalia hyovaginalis]|uniref:Uncharacterized protein n=1 Tax=Schaalia hyovaginalis TaxID=29316 RepID=A0A923E422_9ACTO|nr:hypothetical protein [Schaalia hyovaginalis]MBB6334382.1 hypothetical protein [Schaalia hyovaginalis]